MFDKEVVTALNKRLGKIVNAKQELKLAKGKLVHNLSHTDTDSKMLGSFLHSQNTDFTNHNVINEICHKHTLYFM